MLAFYIAEPDAVVRLDLVGAVRSRFPHVDLVAYSDLANILAEFPNRFLCMILDADLCSDQTRALLDQRLEQGAHLVLVGAPRFNPWNAMVIDRPFTDELLICAILDGKAASPLHPPAAHT